MSLFFTPEKSDFPILSVCYHYDYLIILIFRVEKVKTTRKYFFHFKSQKSNKKNIVITQYLEKIRKVGRIETFEGK